MTGLPADHGAKGLATARVVASRQRDARRDQAIFLAQRGYVVSWIARKLGVSERSIQRYLKGDRT